MRYAAFFLFTLCMVVAGCAPIDSVGLVGTWQRVNDDASTWDDGDGNTRGKRFDSDGTGVYGNFDSGDFTEGSAFEWTLEGTLLTEIGEEERRLTVRAYNGVVLMLERSDNGEPRYFAHRN